MASVLLFPTVATHRRLPHLSKEPKESKAQKDLKHLKVLDNGTHLLPQDNDHHPSSTVDISKQALSLPSSESPQLAITSSNTSSDGQKLLQQHGHGNASPQTKANLSINTTANNDRIKASTAAATSSTTTTKALLSTAPLVETTTSGLASGNKATVTPHGDAHTKQGDQILQEQEYAASLQGHHLHHAPQQQQLHPLNVPHGSKSSVTTPLSALPPSGASTSASSSSSSLHESKVIKTALYDAFGCLYHPVQHTHHPSPSTSSSTASTPHLGSGKLPATTTTALRSGEATPLLGISPRASPMLRPHMGTSAPITPLDLTSSADGHLGEGYFGLHGPSSHSNGMSASGASRHLNTHHHHQTRRASGLHHEDSHHYHHVHHHHSQHHGHHNHETDSPKSLSRRSSLGDFNLNPVEHPVLCSLHTLSLTHPHPPEHYHPHLGHDLGHDRIPITPETCMNGGSGSGNGSTATVASAQTFVQKQSMPNTQPPIQLQHPPMPQKQQQQPMTPGELLSTNTKIKNPNGGKSPFPMDSNSDGPESIGRFSHQGLI
ncbi:hypothetical protein BGX26_004721 [Mortierella sp. AD094]|nr:hypothetical protein BGX26_004721 [Mortierella sp. AD094]